MGFADTEELARDVSSLFSDAGWVVAGRRVGGVTMPRGITLMLKTPEDDINRNVRETIERTGLSVHVQHDAAAEFPLLQIGAREDAE
jgi:hypothetical protein